MSETTVEIKPLNIDLKNDIQNTLRSVGEECVNELKHVSWKHKTGKRSGDYNAGWRYDFEENGTKITVHNAGKDATLTHLLEKGHLVVRNGKSVGFSPAFPHIKPAFNNTKKQYLSDLKKIRLITKGK